MKIFMVEIEICPFCGETIIGDPWNVKEHVNDRHNRRKEEFVPHFDAMIRMWMRK